jgi:undecaprenyl-diphosphatase
MMEWLKIIVLAVLQGITEFLPVSSSGHLVLVEHLLKVQSSGILLEVTLHAGTLISILVFYRKRILQLLRELFSGEGEGRQYAAAVVVGSIPAALAYAAVGKKIEACFSNPHAVAVLLCVTGVMLLTLLRGSGKPAELNVGRGFLVGLAQALALLPGISRSGSTITAARHLGISPEKAAEFSLLLSVPALAGATLIKALEIFKNGCGGFGGLQLGVAMIVSAIVGYVAIVCLVKTLTAGKFWMFGFYCLAVGLLGIVLL